MFRTRHVLMFCPKTPVRTLGIVLSVRLRSISPRRDTYSFRFVFPIRHRDLVVQTELESLRSLKILRTSFKKERIKNTGQMFVGLQQFTVQFRTCLIFVSKGAKETSYLVRVLFNHTCYLKTLVLIEFQLLLLPYLHPP